MAAQNWYSAKLRFVLLVETTGGVEISDSIYMLRSGSFESAFTRFLAIGHDAEQEYLNGAGKLVRWRLKEIVTLDVVDAKELDGVEVHHQFTALSDDERHGFDHVFQPENSQPHQTI
jgi:hypothetical protein